MFEREVVSVQSGQFSFNRRASINGAFLFAFLGVKSLLPFLVYINRTYGATLFALYKFLHLSHLAQSSALRQRSRDQFPPGVYAGWKY